MTSDVTERARELLAGTTSGPWKWTAHEFITAAPDLVDGLLAEVDQLRQKQHAAEATIERVRELLDDLERRGCLACSSATGGDSLADDIRRALDGGDQ